MNNIKPLTKLEPCIFCERRILKIEGKLVWVKDRICFQVWCMNPNCGASGPMRVKQIDAENAWNKVHEKISKSNSDEEE